MVDWNYSIQLLCIVINLGFIGIMLSLIVRELKLIRLFFELKEMKQGYKFRSDMGRDRFSDL